MSTSLVVASRGMLDFVRRRKLSRMAVFRPDHFLPKEVYAKCDFCDSNVVNMLSVCARPVYSFGIFPLTVNLNRGLILSFVA